MSEPLPTIIELAGVSVPSRRDIEVATIENVNWAARAHDFWVIGGMQGSGKSDLMFMLAGLTRPLAGTYRLFGQAMDQRFGDELLANRLRAALVFDDARLINHLTVHENVSLPVRYHQNVSLDDAEEWTNALLQAMGLEEFAREMPSSVGRNWRRRVALARALALRPDVLLLENPLRGLDGRHIGWWVDFATRLWRGHGLMSGKRMTVIATTDEFRPWRNVADHYATLLEREFQAVGERAPEDEQALLPSAD